MIFFASYCKGKITFIAKEVNLLRINKPMINITMITMINITTRH